MPSKQDTIISCDWGTSRFRLRLVNTENYDIISEIITPDGAASFDKKNPGENKYAGANREEYLLGFLQQQIEKLLSGYGRRSDDIQVVISGMASSTIGIRELKYARLPFSASGEDMITEWIPPSAGCRHPVLLLSGVRSDRDVMRGEETQLIGLQHLAGSDINKESEQLYIFPGTHSKHISVKNGGVQQINTYMTGELFSILCEHSILKGTISMQDTHRLSIEEKNAFAEGLRTSGNPDLLNTLFTVRTNTLFNLLTKELNYYYLSGLLIGEEWRSMDITGKQIVLCADAPLQMLYKMAAEYLNAERMTKIISSELANLAVVAGQIAVLKKTPHYE